MFALVQAAPDGILLVGSDGIIRLANEAAEHLFAYSHDELVGSPVERLIPTRLRDAHLALRHNYEAAPVVRPIGTGLELVGMRSDGEEFPVEISLAPVPWEGEQLVVAIVRDRTAQRLAAEERAALGRAQAVEDVVAGLEAIVWESRAPDRSSFSYLGGGEIALLGYPRTTWLEAGFWLSVVHPDDRLAALTFAESARSQDRFELEYRLIAADGKTHHVRDIVTVTRNDDDAIVALRGVIVDVTLRRELEERLAQAQKMEATGQLAGGIAHDFNNLLTIVSGYASHLRGLGDLAAYQDELMQIVAATDRAAELTSQLLSFARRGQSEPELLDPNDVLVRLRPLLARALDASIEFEFVLDEQTPLVLANRSDLEQIVMNLVLNARDAMPDGGTLRIETGKETLDAQAAGARAVPAGDYFSLAVTDSGEGIPAEIQARIFEPFYTTKPEGRGTGMGLATVHGIIEQAGGTIRLDSFPGAGSRFDINLPAASEQRPPSGANGGSGKTILLVEDEEALRIIAARVLRDAGHLVLVAANGSDALSAAARHRGALDLVVTDVVMPLISGPELAQRLRALRPGVQVLFMSGYNDSRLASRGVDAMQAELLYKPFRPDALTSRVNDMLAGATAP